VGKRTCLRRTLTAETAVSPEEVDPGTDLLERVAEPAQEGTGTFAAAAASKD
jgi:hypothetical protein